MADVFQLTGVGFAPEGKSILTDINITVAAGTYTTITGPSGSGKSTLLRLLATMLTPTSGTILFNNQPQTALRKPVYRQTVSYCFQQPSLFGDTVRDNLAFPFSLRNQEFDRDKALAALASVELPPTMLDAKITSLSGGEKQRVALIRNLLFLPQVLLLDEVTTGLDADTKATVHALIERHHQAGMTILAVTHDETEIAAAEKLLTIRAGKLVPDDE
ncbi:ABC transporter ATP-binding protein [Lacticaseibacillus sharpeae]|uniref:ABC transport system ATP-binding protein n=1 Tax=Lacticaseibacillus sharpeae JCM 1186 = DSM 20505 TaxID=1291052 RepID=A0A0R1ZTM3_9LACO|nr:ATP-binding cassette domain-containing protein [Lacticaseibacillus sharpeae]KRM55110.1 ABC transport system ATP-binding protein [Lacticaseibacillus sharpeae JCM 1186 = DSM 20505]